MQPRGGGTPGGACAAGTSLHVGQKREAEAARPQGPAWDADAGHSPRPQSPLRGHPRARPSTCLGLSQKLPGSGQHGASGCQGHARQRREGPGPAARGSRLPREESRPRPSHTSEVKWPEAGHQLPGGGALAVAARALGSSPPRWAQPVAERAALPDLRDLGRAHGPPRSAPVLRMRTGARRPTGDPELWVKPAGHFPR